jgi:hypothetical protein
MFKLGDKVKFKKKHKKYLGPRWKDGVAKVIDCQNDHHWRRQYCRISFDKKALSNTPLVRYDDVGSWLIEHADK